MIFSQKLVSRYKELKEDVPDCLLLMQIGAFMQVMDKDARAVLEKIIEANNARDDRAARLLELRQELESFKVLARLCHESGAFASTRSYLHVAQRITNIARQNEGWLKKTRSQSRQRRKQEAAWSEPQQAQLGLGDLGR